MLARLTAIAALLALAGCAAAMPGYTPPSFKSKNPLAAPAESGGLVESGRYEMSSTEKALDCRRMTGSMQITIARIKDAHYRREPSALAAAAQKTVAPVLSGSTVGSDRQAEYAREYAKLEAYNRQLAAKNCKTVDIKAELAKPAEPIGKKY